MAPRTKVVNGEKETAHGRSKPLSSTKSSSSSSSGRAPRGTKIKKDAEHFCVCKGEDDGRPMVQCGNCHDWFHFDCVSLDENDAADISFYVCPPCTETTGRHPVMNYEGGDTVEPIAQPAPSVQKRQRTKTPTPMPMILDAPSSSEGDATEDEDYTAEDTSKGRRRSKRVARRVESSDSDSDVTMNSAAVKRRASVDVPPKKRARTSSTQQQRRASSAASTSAAEDKLRKFAVDDFTKMITKICEKYPYLREGEDGEMVEKRWPELSEEQRDEVHAAAAAYATEAESALYEQCGGAANQNKNKYSAHLRMLKFNLPKEDRVALHKRIASAELSPVTLMSMSSDELASEEEQKKKHEAEAEALAQSILPKVQAPRAKMTHKGIQDIEDISGQRAREDADEAKTRERIERERLARLRTNSESMPPQSPITPSAVTSSTGEWGGPPPVPVHALESPMSASPSRPLFFPSGSDLIVPTEHDINLGDFIHMDDETPIAMADVPSGLPTPALEMDKPPLGESALESPKETGDSSPVTPFGLAASSPFAASKPDMPPRASFDLSSVWTDSAAASASPKEIEPVEVMGEMDLDGEGEGGEELDFEMFLNNDDEEAPATKVEEEKPQEQVLSVEEKYAKAPHVWKGIVSMPIDTPVPQETCVSARAIGGRELPPDSPLWRTLFPGDHLRVDGRVATTQASKYLRDSLVSPAKELVAVALTAEDEKAAAVMQAISGFLLQKDRYGLVFPWGKRGKEWGSEFYVVPLQRNAPLPSPLERLAGLEFPEQRTEDCFIGVWILNRGKLQPPRPPLGSSQASSSRNVPAHMNGTPVPAYSPPNAGVGGASAYSPPQGGNTPIPVNVSTMLAALSNATRSPAHSTTPAQSFQPAQPFSTTPPQPTPSYASPSQAGSLSTQAQLGAFVQSSQTTPAHAAALAGLANLSVEQLAALPLEHLNTITQLLQLQAAATQASTTPAPGWSQGGAAPTQPAGSPYGQQQFDGPSGRGGFRGGRGGYAGDRGGYSGEPRGGRGRGRGRGRGCGSQDGGWRGRGRGGQWD